MNFDDYKVTTPYPEKPRKPMILRAALTAENARKWADDLEVYEKEMEEFVVKAERWKCIENSLCCKFKQDVLEMNGLKGHPKAEKVYSMAWSQGHSAGYTEVAYWVEKLAELVKD
jgi:hypothetical protein